MGRKDLLEKLKGKISSETLKKADDAAAKYSIGVDRDWNKGWSETVDEKYVEGVNDVIGTEIAEAFLSGIVWFVDQLPAWKPTKQHLEGLLTAINTLKWQLNIGDKRLNSLYEELSNLK